MKTLTLFTPGPYVAHSGSVWQDGPNVYPKGLEEGIPICHMDRTSRNGTTPVERDANAQLLSTAFDGYVLATDILKLADEYGETIFLPKEVVIKARDLVQKALGGSR